MSVIPVRTQKSDTERKASVTSLPINLEGAWRERFSKLINTVNKLREFKLLKIKNLIALFIDFS